MKKNEQNDGKMVELQAKYDELVGDLQRTRADFENYRKQVEMQKENEKYNKKKK